MGIHTFTYLDQNQLQVLTTNIYEANHLFGIQFEKSYQDRTIHKLKYLAEYYRSKNDPFCRIAYYQESESTPSLHPVITEQAYYVRGQWKPTPENAFNRPIYRLQAFEKHAANRTVIVLENELQVLCAIKAGWEEEDFFFSCCIDEDRSNLKLLVDHPDLWILSSSKSGIQKARKLSRRLPSAKFLHTSMYESNRQVGSFSNKKLESILQWVISQKLHQQQKWDPSSGTT